MKPAPAFRIDPARKLRDEFGRIVEETCDAVAVHLNAADHRRGLHEARKALKKLRALLRLVRAAEPKSLKVQEHRFRDAARAIAGSREATAAVETLERLIAAHPDRIVDCRLGEIRCHLLARCAQAGAGLDEARGEASALCIEARDELRGLAFDEKLSDDAVLAEGMERTLRHWKKALEAAGKDGEAEDFHELRKAVKAHWAQLGLLRAFGLRGVGQRREAVEALGERLGELNDIHVMREAVARGTLGPPADLDTRAFDRLLKKEAKALAAAALPQAKKLLQSRPDGLRRRMRKAAAKLAA
ncbi:CHAD domain-containing protein [Neoaquamicrobium microcysteis]|uniref:CHAD domain-containing protein n=1 Tax=Neoaquamicrobium microcysteis TaxID=2682781 RepID=UPI001375DA70|nr:CHAD domain-containing protein [Mesorhizobium microcysteis]